MKIGKLPENVYERSVKKNIQTQNDFVLESALSGDDCALFELSESDKMYSDTVSTCVCTEAEKQDEEALKLKAEPVFTVLHILRVLKDRLLIKGGQAKVFSLNFLLPESFEEPELKVLVKDADNAAKTLECAIAECKVTIMSQLRTPVLTAVCFAVPEAAVAGKALSKVKASKNASSDRKAENKEKDIILTKAIALEGTAYLAEQNKGKLQKSLPLYMVDRAISFEEMLGIDEEIGIAKANGDFCLAAGEGGIFAALWNAAEKEKVGMKVDLKKIPIRQETVEVCEVCEVNPYELLSGGCLIIFAGNGNRTLEALREKGIRATVIGRTNATNDRIIMNEDEVRYMDRPHQDAIYNN